MLNEIIFNYNYRNIEFYSNVESFSQDNENLWKILESKRVKIFKQRNLELIKKKFRKGKLI
jgi:hypothetical protein